MTAPVNTKAKIMYIYLGCLTAPTTNKATIWGERTVDGWNAKGTKTAGATTIAATLTIPNDSSLKTDANQKCRFGIELRDQDTDASVFQNAGAYTWNQTSTGAQSDTKYIELKGQFKSSNGAPTVSTYVRRLCTTRVDGGGARWRSSRALVVAAARRGPVSGDRRTHDVRRRAAAPHMSAAQPSRWARRALASAICPSSVMRTWHRVR